MERVYINTIESIKADLAAGKRTIKKIAAECRVYEEQATCDEAKAAFARLSDCATRKEFAAVFATI